MPPNQNPDQGTRDRIDATLGECGWAVQDNKTIDYSGLNVAFMVSGGVRIEPELRN